MPSSTLPCILLATTICIKYAAAVHDADGGAQFIYYNGFRNSNLILGDAASITKDGILSLTNGGLNTSGRGWYASNLLSAADGTASYPYCFTFTSFSTTFVFTVSPHFSVGSGDEMAFLLSSTTDHFSGTLPGASDFFFAIVLGVDLNKPVCIIIKTSTVDNWDCPLISNYEELMRIISSGKPVQLWADYNGTSMALKVTLALILKQEPASPPLLSYTFNNTPDLQLDRYYFPGFAASTGNNNGATTHQVLGWSFSLGGAPVQPLNYSLLPQIQAPTKTVKNLIKWLLAAVSVLTLVTISGIVLRCWHKKIAEAEQEGLACVVGPRRFLHKDLCKATNGFSSGQLLGKGGFGRVYVGALDASGSMRVAVKRVSSESKQGLPQFMAEIVILGRLRHRNLVPLIGYCRHKDKDELLLVYELMPNGSLDRYLHGESEEDTLVWSQRLHVIKGVASGLLYLHEDCEKVIVHRDVKASNVLLDAEMNGRLGDFGLARLHDHGADANTTRHIAGTRGYLAPELLRLGQATKASDVFAFGAFILEVVCGRRPMGFNAHGEPLVLVDWVRQVWASGCIIDAIDSRLKDFVVGEVELVLKLGLLCSHPLATTRPGMRLVLQYLDEDLPLPEFSPDYLTITNVEQVLETTHSVATTITCLSGGR